MCITSIALRGSIVEVSKRHGMKKYLTGHIFLGILQFLFAILGLLIIQHHSSIPCSTDLDNGNKVDLLLLSVVVISQLIDILSLFCCCYLFSSNPVGMLAQNDENMTNEIWVSRCRVLCKSIQLCSCNIFGGSNIHEDLEALAKVLTNFFHHDGFLDVVPSDVVAGIILVRLQQRNQIHLKFEEENSRYGSHETDLNIESGLEVSRVGKMSRKRSQYLGRHILQSNSDHKELDLFARCSVYALSAYTSMILMYMKPVSGLCSLCVSSLFRQSWCTKCRRKAKALHHNDKNITGDNLCGINEASVYSMVKKMNAELVYAAFENDTVAKPYCIYIDREIQSIIIAIRGTLSLEDCVTDALAECVNMGTHGSKWGFDGTKVWTHNGFLKAAEKIREDIETSKILNHLFSNNAPEDLNKGVNTPLNAHKNGFHGDFSAFDLLITGHSLGAGVAVVLGLLLKPIFPHLKCVTFGTPNSVFDRDTALGTTSFVTSIVLDNDIICRTSALSLAKLRNDVLDSISRAKVSKMMIMQALFKDFDPDLLLYPRGKAPASDFLTNVSEFISKSNKNISNITKEVPLCIPGRIVHLIKAKDASCFCLTRSKYTPVDAFNDDFSDIVISPNMALDHFPDVYVYACNSLSSKSYF